MAHRQRSRRSGDHAIGAHRAVQSSAVGERQFAEARATVGVANYERRESGRARTLVLARRRSQSDAHLASHRCPLRTQTHKFPPIGQRTCVL
mmetsp:Transcript_43316/g.100459  ORF Transcript_43316/g.100459 Transcript_43316/m.100459 type:complete len:92 (+) Transcript_43316:342-617(+)